MISRPLRRVLLATLAACGVLLAWDDDDEADTLLLPRNRPAVGLEGRPDGQHANADGARSRAAVDAVSATGLAATATPQALPAGHAAWPDLNEQARVAWSAPAPPAPPPPPRSAQQALAAVVTQPAPPQPPSAPPFAFELIGTVAEGSGLGALLQGPQQSLWVRAGDTVDGAWRVQRVEARGVDLLWLPQQLPARIGYRAPS